MKLTAEQRRAVERLRSVDEGEPSALRRRIVETVMEVGEADRGVWYTMGRVDRKVVLSEWEGHLEISAVEAMMAGTPWPVGDPRRPPRRALRRFLSSDDLVDDWDRFYGSVFYARVFEPPKIRDQLRLLVYDGPRFVGWIGGFRRAGEPRFGSRDARRLAPLVDPVASALVAADRMAAAQRPEQGCDLLVAADGRVEFASQAGRQWLRRPGAQQILAEWARAADQGRPVRHAKGWVVRWSRMYGDGRVRYLLQLSPPSPVLVHPVDRLSPARREVAQLAAAGAHSREIARMTGRSTETVRSHLKAIYRELDIASRAELAALMASASG